MECALNYDCLESKKIEKYYSTINIYKGQK